MIQALFCDLFETIVTEFDPHWKPGATIADELGVNAKLFAMEWSTRRDKRMVGGYPDFRSALRDICRALEHPVDEGVLRRIHQERLARYARVFAKIDDKVVHVLKTIKRAGLKLGLISNCTPEEVAAWHTCCLAETFDDAVFSWQVQHAEPDVSAGAI